MGRGGSIVLPSTHRLLLVAELEERTLVDDYEMVVGQPSVCEHVLDLREGIRPRLATREPRHRLVAQAEGRRSIDETREEFLPHEVVRRVYIRRRD